MRHVLFNRDGQPVQLSVQNCLANIDRMFCELDREGLGMMPVQILCSPVERAVFTAGVVEKEIENLDRRIHSSYRVLNWLRVLSKQINDMNIGAMLHEYQDCFLLFVSHEPDIMDYLGVTFGVPNCSIHASTFQIT